MQVMPVNNVSFKSYVCNHFEPPIHNPKRDNAWMEVVEDARKNNNFGALDIALNSVLKNGDDNILALERKNNSDVWMIALYKNMSDISNDRSIDDKLTFSSINQNAIIIDKFLKGDKTTKYRIIPLNGEWVMETKEHKSLSSAVISVLEGLKHVSNKTYSLLTADKYLSPKKYLERFAKKVIK